MADILIRGMEMPKDCGSCVFCENEMFQKYCPLSDNYYDWDESSTGNRPSDCPLVPLPEGHGRLGDLDAIIKSLNEVEADFDKKGFNQGACWFHVIAELLKKAPTIVPAEGGNADV